MLGIIAAPVAAFAAYAVISPVAAIALPAIVILGIAFWGTEAIRSRGVRHEKRLLPLWDQFPTTRSLRLRDGSHDNDLVKRREAIEILTDEVLPSQADELREPDAIDLVFVERVKRVLVQMRSSSAYRDILQSENASYGFHRNMLAMRIPALVLLDVAIALNGVIAIGTDQPGIGLVLVGVHALLLFAWIRLVGVRQVTEQSERFAERFWINAIEMASAKRATRPKRNRAGNGRSRKA